MADKIVLAVNCKAYLVAGTEGAETYDNLENLSEVTVTGEWAEGDASTRDSAVKHSEPTQLTLEVSGKVKVNLDTDTTYLKLATAHAGRTSIKILVCDGELTAQGSRGWLSEWKVFGLGGAQGLTEVLFKDFTIKPCAGAVTKYATVGASSAVTYVTI